MESVKNACCPISATLDLIGGKYKAYILWHLSNKTLRFSELRKLVSGATPKMLTQQLRELEDDGLLNRTVYPVVPPKVEYALTASGRSLRPVLDAMFTWGSRMLTESGKKPDCSMMGNHSCSCKKGAGDGAKTV